MSKIQVYHFHNGTAGGVLSVIRNLLRFSNNLQIENHIIYTINKESIPAYLLEPIAGAVTEQVFYYSPKWNFYFTCKQLAKLLPGKGAVIVAHDWLELGMASQLGLQNRVVSFLHGDYDYYYQLAKLHAASIDSFITIANNIAVKLKALLPAREKDIHYLRFPVPSFNYLKRSKSSNNIIFIGRLTEAKGYHLLPAIDSLLQSKNIFLNWHIIGDDNDKAGFGKSWNKNSLVQLYGAMDNAAVLSLLQSMDFFILPSMAEGMPVSLIESMKAGVIPLVNNIEGGIQELVIDNETGFRIKNNDPADYVDRITALIQNTDLYNAIASNSIKKANALFDPGENTHQIEVEICNVFSVPLKSKRAKRVYGSRLDQKWLPNIFTKSIRNLK